MYQEYDNPNSDKSHQVLLYLGTTFLGDFNKFAKNRHFIGTLKSEATTATADEFTFDISKRKFADIVAKNFDDDPDSMLKMLKLNVVYLENSRIIFSGVLGSSPARSGDGARQIISLKFYEWFWRLSGDLVVDPANWMSPYRRFDNRPAHLYAQDLINEAMSRFAAGYDPLNWTYGHIDTLANKTMEYKDFQTVAKALLDAMNNTQGAGKFDVVVRTDPNNFAKQIIDILAPRGHDKNIIINFPSDGVASLWSSDFSLEETNDFASNVVVAGSGDLGNPTEMANTPVSFQSDTNFSQSYGYFREFNSQSGLTTQPSVDDFAKKRLMQKTANFAKLVPQIKLVGRPIAWMDAGNDNNGLSLGDGFYFRDESHNGVDQSGWMRIIGLDISWDNIGVATAVPTLARES